MTILSILRLAPNPSPSVLNKESSSLRFLDINGLDFILGLILLRWFFRKLFYLSRQQSFQKNQCFKVQVKKFKKYKSLDPQSPVLY